MRADDVVLQAGFGPVRRARPEDAARVTQMVAALARHRGDVPALTAEALIRDSAGPNPWVHLLVAEAQGGLIGYAALCPQVRLQFGTRGMDLHQLFTDAEWRGKGVGQGLVEAASAPLRPCPAGSYLTVGTHPENHRAQAFYEALGFERQDCRPPRFVIRW